jgi:hypothetical protein
MHRWLIENFNRQATLFLASGRTSEGYSMVHFSTDLHQTTQKPARPDRPQSVLHGPGCLLGDL